MLFLSPADGYGEGEGLHKEFAGVKAGVAVCVARQSDARAAGGHARVLRMRRRRVQRILHRQSQA